MRRSGPLRWNVLALTLAVAAGGCGHERLADPEADGDALQGTPRTLDEILDRVCSTEGAAAVGPGDLEPKIVRGERLFGDVVACDDVDVAREAWIGGNLVAGCRALTEAHDGARLCRGSDGDADVERDVVIEGHVVARGDVDLEKGTVVFGCVVAAEDVDVEDDAWIGGSVIAYGDVDLEKRTVIEGDVCIIGDGDLDCDRRSRVAGMPCRAYRPQPLEVCAAACFGR